MIKFPFEKVQGAESCRRANKFPERFKELKAVEGQTNFRKGCLQLKAVRIEYGPLQ